MKNKILTLVLFVILFANGCTTTKVVKTYRELYDDMPNTELNMVTVDSSFYKIKSFSITDSSIKIIGKKTRGDSSVSFSGEIPFYKIALIQVKEFSWTKTLMFSAAMATLVTEGLPIALEEQGLNGVAEIVSPSGYGSCPYIYSWNGKRFLLEGEAFGVALGKKMEYETATVLRNLKSINGFLNIRLSNKRPESHFFNRIRLVAAEAEPEAKIFTGVNNKLWKVKNVTLPFYASGNGKNITRLLLKKDNVYWNSDFESANIKNNFEDKLIVSFPASKELSNVSLVVSAINTGISSIVFKKLQNTLGAEYINFLRGTEEDSEIINILKNTLKRSALKIDYWNGKKWVYKGMILPEANNIEFQKLFHFSIKHVENDSIKIRLRCLTDVWRLDALFLDETGSELLGTESCRLLKAKLKGKSVLNKISEIDKNYAVILPGENINLKFKTPRAKKGKKLFYALLADGYLYEWLITKNNLGEKKLTLFSAKSTKMQTLKILLNNLDLFLPTIYEEWKLLKRNYLTKVQSNKLKN